MDKIAGRNQVMEALSSGRRLERIYVAMRAEMPELIGMARAANVPIKSVDRRYLDSLVKEKHQGVVALAEPIAYHSVDDLLDVARARGEVPLLVALNNVEDPQNLGSVLRSADGAGAHGVIIPARRSAGLTTAVGRASAGAIEHVKVAQVTNMARCVESLRREGLWAIGFDSAGEGSYWDVDFRLPTLLVVGGEAKGLGRLVSEKCDLLVRIPMSGRIGSLNAGVAAALGLYEAQRQRTVLACE